MITEKFVAPTAFGNLMPLWVTGLTNPVKGTTTIISNHEKISISIVVALIGTIGTIAILKKRKVI